MRSFLRFSLCVASLLTASCGTLKEAQEAKAKRKLEQFAADLRSAEPVKADSSGKYPAGAELAVLDGLLQKYPGRQVTKTVVEVRTITVPGKSIAAPVPVKADTAANRIERDSILRDMVRLTAEEKKGEKLETAANATARADGLRAEVARLKVRLLAAFNRRGCLPDTTVYFPKDSASFTIKRVDDTHYLFTCTVAPRTIKVPVRIDQTENKRIAQDMRFYWQFWQFWAAVGTTVVAWALAGYFTVAALRGRNG